MRSFAILLAAGQSERFGEEDKLLAPLNETPLVVHAADRLRHSACERCIIVTSNTDVARAVPDFENVHVPADKSSLSASLSAGVGRAKAQGAARVLVALGDMPFVRDATLQEVLGLGALHGVSAAFDGVAAMPPVSFRANHFDALLEGRGDQGARRLLRDLPTEARVTCDRAELIDVDTFEDLQHASERLADHMRR